MRTWAVTSRGWTPTVPPGQQRLVMGDCTLTLERRPACPPGAQACTSASLDASPLSTFQKDRQIHVLTTPFVRPQNETGWKHHLRGSATAPRPRVAVPIPWLFPFGVSGPLYPWAILLSARVPSLHHVVRNQPCYVGSKDPDLVTWPSVSGRAGLGDGGESGLPVGHGAQRGLSVCG